jgi:hypothetical protein
MKMIIPIQDKVKNCYSSSTTHESQKRKTKIFYRNDRQNPSINFKKNQNQRKRIRRKMTRMRRRRRRRRKRRR